jgi:hypothetical protein
MYKSGLLLRLSFIPALLFLLIAPSAYAQTSGNTVFRFLDVPTNARMAALSGNHVALKDADLSLFQANPAYLNASSSRRFSISYINFLADANYAFANTAYHLDGIGTIGLGIRYAGYGEFDRLDENNVQSGTFRPGDFAFTGAISRAVFPNIQAGASVDWIYSRIDEFTSSALTLNTGLLYRNPDNDLTLGFTIRNLGTQLSTFNGEYEPLPLDISLGMSHKPANFPVRMNVLLRQLNKWEQPIGSDEGDPGFGTNFFRHLVLGGEIDFSENLAFRMGYNQLQHEELSTRSNFDFAGVGLGLGIKFNKFMIDFSRSSFSELGGIFQISVTSRIKQDNRE